MKLNDAEIRAIWDNAASVPSKNVSITRKDATGAFIKLAELGKQTEFGWVIVPLIEETKQRLLTVNDCVALHWENAKSYEKLNKKNNTFTAKVISESNSGNVKNIKKDRPFTKANILKTIRYSYLWDKNTGKSKTRQEQEEN